LEVDLEGQWVMFLKRNGGKKGKWEWGEKGRRTDFRSDFWRQMYRNQRFSSSWIFEGMAFVEFSCNRRQEERELEMNWERIFGDERFGEVWYGLNWVRYLVVWGNEENWRKQSQDKRRYMSRRGRVPSRR
jgi:hypothetical protein